MLCGRVVDTTGAGVEDVAVLQAVERGVGGVRATVPSRGIPLGVTDSRGLFRVGGLAPGPWCLVFDSARHLPRVVRGRTSAPGTANRELPVVLEVGEALEGRVSPMSRELAGRLRVEARLRPHVAGPASAPGGTPAAGTPAGTPEGTARARRALVGADGAFSLRGLLPGARQTLTVWREAEDGRWHLDPSIPGVEAWPGQAEVELRREQTATLVFRAVDAQSDDPVEEMIVWTAATDRDEGRFRVLARDGGRGPIVRHPDGRVRIEGLRVPADGARLRLRVRAVGYRELTLDDIVLEGGEVGDLGPITLDRVPVVRVRVTDSSSGLPVPGARIMLAGEGEPALRWLLSDSGPDAAVDERVRSAVTDERGWASLTCIPGKRCVVRAAAEGRVASDATPVPPGEAPRIELSLEAGATVVVSVVDPQGRPSAGVGVLSWRSSEDGAAGDGPPDSLALPEPSDADGITRFTQLRAGTWLFGLAPEFPGDGNLLDPTREGIQAVELAAGDSRAIVLRDRSRGKLFGRITESRLPLFGAELTLCARGRQNAGSNARVTGCWPVHATKPCRASTAPTPSTASRRARIGSASTIPTEACRTGSTSSSMPVILGWTSMSRSTGSRGASHRPRDVPSPASVSRCPSPVGRRRALSWRRCSSRTSGGRCTCGGSGEPPRSSPMPGGASRCVASRLPAR